MKKLLLITFTLSVLQLYCQTDSICKGVMKVYDKFEDKTSYKSEPHYFIRFMKIIKGVDTVYGLHLEASGRTVSVGKKGVIILLSDSTKMEFPNTDINVNYNSFMDNYTYTATIVLKKPDIERLIKSYITDFRLYIYEGTNNAKLGIIAMGHLQCLLLKQ